ncbi:MAG: ATP-binding cassette domain-containing protein [Planctomycetes bacterium]|nr:ATP-binding cassette domain-containing protein [Planctomycetota bacterium]MBI3835753.1 ATP-binding cassette domain-containing protein [Planctomycetota bacterium]
MAAPVIQVEGVSKEFRLDRGHRSLREAFTSFWRPNTGNDSSHRFNALRDVTFCAAEGEALGIIGPNGAGKSTILKLLAGILRPDTGRIRVTGRSAAMIEVGAGFHGDLTGRENIFLNGAILGMPRNAIQAKLDSIVAFAGIERFLDMPVKRYSSGMYARLGFAIAIHTEPRVLLIDEVLSVGDAVYRVRCLDRMRSLVEQGVTLILVTHDLDQMQSICKRAIVLDDGTIAYDGPASSAATEYLTAMTKSQPSRTGDIALVHGCEKAELVAFRVLDELSDEVTSIAPNDSITLDLQLRFPTSVNELAIEINLHRVGRGLVMSLNSDRDDMRIQPCDSCMNLEIAVMRLPLCAGRYCWSVRVWRKPDGALLLDTPLMYPIAIEDVGTNAGAIAVNREWRLSTEAKYAKLPIAVGVGS